MAINKMNLFFIKGGGLLIAFLTLQIDPTNVVEWSKLGLAIAVIAALFQYVVKPVMGVFTKSIEKQTEAMGQIAIATQMIAKDLTELNNKHDNLHKNVQNLNVKVGEIEKKISS